MFFDRLSEEAGVDAAYMRKVVPKILVKIQEAADAGSHGRVFDLVAHFGALMEQERARARGQGVAHEAAMILVHRVLQKKIAASRRMEFGLAELLRAAAVPKYQLSRHRRHAPGIVVRCRPAAPSPVLVWRPAEVRL